MTAIALKREIGSVELVGDRLLINDLELTGTIVTLARDAEAAGEDLLPLVALVTEVGACVVQHGGSQTVVSALATATDRLEKTLSDGAAQLPAELRKGSTELLELLRNELKVGLAGFDATRVDSVQNQLKDASGELVKKAVDDLMADGGAFAALVEKVATQLQVLGRTNGDLVERITSLVERAEANLRLTDAHERSTQKGVPFEEYLLPELEAIHGPLGDTVTHASREDGANNKVGDFVITINPRETRGREVRMVVEAKTGRLSAPKVTEELEEARANREAAAAIIVFDDVEDAKSILGGRHFGQRPGGDFVVVADPDEWSPLALEVACRHARALAIASLESDVVLDGQWIEDQCDRIVGLIEAARDIKSNTKQARRGLDRIDERYDVLREEALLVLDAIKERLVVS